MSGAAARGAPRKPPGRPAPAGLAALAPLARALLPALGLILVVLGLCFHAEVVAAVQVWNTSTAYGHCWLVVPIALWLLWERRATAAQIAPAPFAWPALAALPLALFWLAGDVVGVMEARQIAAVLILECALAALLGWRLWWALSPAFLYLLFLVPFGAFLTPALQSVTAAFVRVGLDALDIPSRVTELTIEIPEGGFYIAEACAGLRFLIASIAFGVLYAVTMFQSPWRRAGYIALACVVPVIANGFRALGIVVLGHVLGSAEAAAADHIIYGWVFFSFVIVLLALAGMPFREEPAAPAVPARAVLPAGLGRRGLIAAWLVLLAGATGPMVALALDRAGTPGRPEALLVPPQGCEAGASALGDGLASQEFFCGQEHFRTRLRVLPRGANPLRVVSAATADVSALVSKEADLDGGQLHLENATPSIWVLRSDRQTGVGAAYVFWAEGAAATGGVRDRLRLAAGLLGGAPDHPVALTVTVSGARGLPADALRAFLEAQGNLAPRLAALSRP